MHRPSLQLIIQLVLILKVSSLNHILLNEVAGAAFFLTTDDAIADSGAIQIFVMDGAPVINKQATTRPFKVSLANGRQVMPTHMCDIHVDSLPFVLTGHIIPDLSISSLFGICISTEAGCEVMFTNKECIVCYNSKLFYAARKMPRLICGCSRWELWT